MSFQLQGTSRTAMSEVEFLTRLRFTAWRTMGARFNAARRLKRRDIIGAFSIAVFAMIGVGLAIVQPIYEIKPGNLDNFLTALSVLLGMFVVAISLIEWGYQGGHKAEVLYRTGEELTEFHRKLDQILSTSKDVGDINSLRIEYEQIKRRCPYNHEPVDDRAFRAEHPAEFKDAAGNGLNAFSCICYRLAHFVSPALYFGILWLIVLALLVAMPWSEINVRTPTLQQKH